MLPSQAPRPEPITLLAAQGRRAARGAARHLQFLPKQSAAPWGASSDASPIHHSWNCLRGMSTSFFLSRGVVSSAPAASSHPAPAGSRPSASSARLQRGGAEEGRHARSAKRLLHGRSQTSSETHTTGWRMHAARHAGCQAWRDPPPRLPERLLRLRRLLLPRRATERSHAIRAAAAHKLRRAAPPGRPLRRPRRILPYLVPAALQQHGVRHSAAAAAAAAGLNGRPLPQVQHLQGEGRQGEAEAGQGRMRRGRAGRGEAGQGRGRGGGGSGEMPERNVPH